MENNVVSLETAKKLKAAGFPQDSVWLWRLLVPTGANKLIERIEQEYDDNRFRSERPEHVRFRQENEFYAAPTATEIYLASGKDSCCNYAMPEAAAHAYLKLKDQPHE